MRLFARGPGMLPPLAAGFALCSASRSIASPPHRQTGIRLLFRDDDGNSLARRGVGRISFARSPLGARGASPQIALMSRAFVKETDDIEDLPERPISAAPNLVTATGLAAIEAEIARLQDALGEAGEDRAARAAIGRDLRYWTARRGSAQVQPPPEDCDEVRFGCTVHISRDDGREQSFRIVGEDEADPEQGTLSYVSPLARVVMGKEAGDVVRLGAAEIEILGVG